MMEQDFLWGVATSSFQIEGQIQNDMTEWEAGGGFRQNGKDPVYADASDHWRNWEADFELLRQLNVNAYRYSIEWARVEPEPGRFDHPFDNKGLFLGEFFQTCRKVFTRQGQKKRKDHYQGSKKDSPEGQEDLDI